MIVVMKNGFTQEDINEVIEVIQDKGADVDKIDGTST